MAQTAAAPDRSNAQHRNENGEMLGPVTWTFTYDSDTNADVSGGNRTGGAYLHRLGLIGDADAAAKLDGVAKVLVADDAIYDHQLAEPVAALIVSLAGDYSAIVSGATTSAKNIMPRVAALLDVMQISEIIKVVSPDTFERPIYAGNAIQTVQSADKIKVITVRTAAFDRKNSATSAVIAQARILRSGRAGAANEL